MPKLWKLSFGIFGIYTGLTVATVGSHWYNTKQPNSWQLPQTKVTKPLSQRLNYANEMERRSKIEQSIINLFAVQATQKDFECIDRNVEFEDPMGFRIGRDAMKTVLLDGGTLISDHKMKDLVIERYSNAFALRFDQSLTICGLSIYSLPTIIYCELNEDNSKVIKCNDLWNGRPFLRAFGTGRFIRKVNGKLVYDWLIRATKLVP